MAIPVITLNGDSVVKLLTSEVSGWTDPGATASDAEDGDITGSIVTTGSPEATVGTYWVIYTVTDSDGNEAIPKAREVQVGNEGTVSSYNIEYNIVGQSTQTTTSSTTSETISGLSPSSDYEVRVQGDDGSGNTSDWTPLETFTTLADTTKPVITLNGDANITIDTDEAQTWTDPGATATDNVDGDITNDIVTTGTVGTSVGTYTIDYDVTDSSGNQADTVTRTVEVVEVDETPPTITLTDGQFVTVAQDSTWTDPGYTATDNVDGDITNDVTVTGTVDTSVLDTYHLKYTVSDAAGNTTTKWRQVSVAEEVAANEYNVEYRFVGSSNSTTITSTTTSETLTGLAQNGPYEFRVQGVNGSTLSSFTNWQTFTTLLAPINIGVSVSGGDYETLKVTVNDVIVSEGEDFYITGTCNDDTAEITVTLDAQNYTTFSEGGNWSIFFNQHEGIMAQDEQDELTTGSSAILLEGSTQDSGNDVLLWE